MGASTHLKEQQHTPAATRLPLMPNEAPAPAPSRRHSRVEWLNRSFHMIPALTRQRVLLDELLQRPQVILG